MSVTRIGPYRIGKTLGIGSFSKVKLGVHELTGQKVAIKILNRKKLKKMDMGAKVRTEIEILRLFTHPHIIRLYEVIDTPTDIYTVMEYVSGGELFDYIVQKGKLEEKEARYFFQQIISGVEYCHVHMVVHRDLKPENLLLDADNHVKLADFGLSNMMKDGQFLKTSCGSPNYAAPEVISGNLYAGPEVDVWSCGVILYAILCGSLPFDDENIRNLFRKIKGGVYTIPSYVSKEARDLIARMLIVDPLKRITIQEIRQHNWFLTNLPTYLAASAEQQIEQSKTIDEETLNAVVTMGFERQRVLAALAMGGELLTSRKMAHHVEARQMAVVYNLMLDLKRKKEQDESNRALAEAKDKKAGASGGGAAGAGGADDVKARLGAVYGPGGSAAAGSAAMIDANGKPLPPSQPFAPSAASKDMKDLNAKEAAKCQDDIKQHNLTNPSAVKLLFDRTKAAGGGAVSPVAGGPGAGSTALIVAGSGVGVGGNNTAMVVGSVGSQSGQMSIPVTPTTGASGSKGRWFLGRWSNSEPQAIMKEVYRLLTKYNFEWKVLGVYKLKARYPPGLVDPNSGHGVHKNQVVKIGVQLYKTPRNLYVLDLQKLYGEMFLFLNFMSTFVSSIRI